MKKSGTVYWICGLAGSGKTAIAEKFSKKLKDYSYEGRLRLAKIYSKITKMLSDQGFLVIVSVIAMFDEIFEFNRKNIKNYVEVFLDVPMDELIRRDKKKLYSKAINREIKHVVGIDVFNAVFPEEL